MTFPSFAPRPLVLLTLFTSFLLLNGCASITNGSQQQVTIKTGKNTEIYINGRYAGKGYSSKKLARDQQHKIQLALGDCKQTFTTQAKFNKMSLLGLMVDAGLVSIPVDFMTGAAWTISPNTIQGQPDCSESAQL